MRVVLLGYLYLSLFASLSFGSCFVRIIKSNRLVTPSILSSSEIKIGKGRGGEKRGL